MNNILICDDDRAIVSALDIYLTSEGYHTISAYDGAQAVKAVEENDVIFMLGMLNRFRTESRLLTERRLSGQMGEIYHADARWMRRRGVPANAWFSQKALAGGGAGLDIGVHAIDTAWYLMGCPEPISVSGITHHRLGRATCRGTEQWGTEAPSNAPMDTEEAAAALIRFEGKKSMTVTVSWVINGAEEDFNLRLYGTRAGGLLYVMYVAQYFVLFIPAGVLCWLFPLLGRFEYGVRGLFRTALQLTIAHLPSTVIIVMLTAQSAVFCLNRWWPVVFLPTVAVLLVSLFTERIFQKYVPELAEEETQETEE